MTRLEIVDPLTLRISTASPAPLLPLDLSGLPILSRTAAAGAAPEGRTTAELNRGEGLVGTGPFKFVDWKRGSELVLARNDAYWGPKPAWEKVTFRPLTNAASRVAALLAGDVDMIEDPPTADLPKLKREPRLALAEAVSSRVIYLALDQFAEPSPGIPDTNGKNPLKDRQVRQALSQAIDRKAHRRQDHGGRRPAGRRFPAVARLRHVEGHRARQVRCRRCPHAAVRRRLPQRLFDHFGHAQRPLHQRPQGGAGRGVDVEPDRRSRPRSRRRRRRCSSRTATSSSTAPISPAGAAIRARCPIRLRALAATPNREKGMGGTNRGRYSNPAMDAKLEEAMRTVDDAKREALLQEASRLVIADYGLLPLHFELSVWAMRHDLTYAGRADQATLAQFVQPKSRHSLD